MRATFRFILLFCAALGALQSRSAIAQPASVNRIVHSFDFEERRLGNVESLPMNWQKVDGDGLPAYVNGELSTTQSRSGRYAFQFDLNGGSLIYRYPAGLLPVQLDAHYRVSGFVKTTAAPNARARATAYFTDVDGHVIIASLAHSKLLVSDAGSTTWLPLSIDLSADDPAAAFLVIELEFLNPANYAPADLGKATLFPQDIRATAWFDDISVSQIPLVTLSTDHPGNIFGSTDPLKLDVLINDRFTDDLSAALVVTDRSGKTIYQKSGALDMSVAEQLSPRKKRMSLSIGAELSPGWYRASLEMSSQGQFVGKQTLDLIRLPGQAAALSPDSRFGMVATDLPIERWSDLPSLLSLLGAGRVKLAVWNESNDVQHDSNASTFDELLETLASQNVSVTACLKSLPASIRAKIHAARMTGGNAALLNPTNLAATAAIGANPGWAELLKAPLDTWQPQLAYLISRHANHLDRWQLGDDGDDGFATNATLRAAYKLVYDQFSALLQKPDLAVPWPAMYELGAGSPGAIAMSIKSEVLPFQLPLYLADLNRKNAVGIDSRSTSIYLEPLDRAKYGRDTQIRDFAQRICYALVADAMRIDLKLPFDIKHDIDSVSEQPDELFMITRTMIALLGNSTYKGKVPLADGVEAFLFDRAGTGVIMLWNRGDETGVKQLALSLGKRPMQVDLFGNVTPLVAPMMTSALTSPMTNSMTGSMSPARPSTPVDTLPMTLGPMPMFLVGIDSQLAQLRASLAFDNDHLESNFRPHTRRVHFTNTFHNAISGSVKLIPPQGWTINPPTQQFSLNAGESFDRDITIEFPYNSIAGDKTITAVFHLSGDSETTFTVPMALKLGLTDVGLQTIALRDGNDVIVQQMITNYGEAPINYTSFAIYPGQARQERLVTDLPPGRTTMKKYRFTSVAFAAGATVRSGLREVVGTRVLNDAVEIH